MRNYIEAKQVTAAMVTPELLRERVAFTGTGGWFSRPGYDEVEVDDFLEVVADRLEQLLHLVNELEHPAPAAPLVEHWPAPYLVTEKGQRAMADEEVWE